MPVIKFARTTGSEQTVFPQPSVMEIQTPNLAKDRGSTAMDSGHLYGFVLAFAEPGRLPVIPGDDDDYAEYFFTVAPKSVTLSEPATVQIQPTMGRGYLVEHQGSLMKQLSISGTTGFRPMSSMSSANPILGAVAGQTDTVVQSILGNIAGLGALTDIRGIPPNEKTGYLNFMTLRNLFRNYVYHRSVGIQEGSRKIPYLIWVNFHEYEFWVCEPTSFTTHREASSPLTFSYDIACTLLSNLAAVKSSDIDWLSRLVTQHQYIGKARELVSRLTKVVIDASRIPDAVFGDLTNASLNVVSALTQILYTSRQLIIGGQNLIALPEAVARNTVLLAQNLVDEIEQTQDVLAGRNLQYSNLVNINSLNESIRIINHMICAKRDQQSQGESAASNAVMADQRNAYSGAVRRVDGEFEINPQDKGASPNFGDASDIRNAPPLINAATTQVMKGEGIRDISDRMYGERDRWKEIAIYNGLEHPYISDLGGMGVLAPGDDILIPGVGDSSNVANNMVLSTGSDDFDDGVTTALATFGRDIQVVFGRGNAGQVILDIAVSPKGDMATIEGVANFTQAMTLMSNTEISTLKAHPYYGFPVFVGSKVNHSTAVTWTMKTRQSLLNDPRVADVKNVGFGISGDVAVGKVEIIGQKSLARVPITSMQRV